MSIINIGALQNPNDITYLTSYTDNYLIQSLANLGQRIGIKGEGIEYKDFTFYDLLDSNDSSSSSAQIYPASSYIGVVYYTSDEENSKAVIGIAERGKRITASNSETFISETSSVNIYNRQFIDDDLSFNIIINNIEKYKAGGVLDVNYNDACSANVMTSLMYGKYAGNDENIYGNIEILYNQFDIDSNMLLYAVRVFKLYTASNNNDYYLMLVLEKSTDSSYLLKAYSFESNAIDSAELAADFKNSFNCKLLDSSNSFYILNNAVLSVLDSNSEIFIYNGESSSNVFGIIKANNGKNSTGAPDITLTLNYNSSESQYLSVDTESSSASDIKKLNSILGNGNLTIDMILNRFSNDITYCYPRFLEYFNHKQYNDSLKTLSSKIVTSLYEQIVKDESDGNTEVSYGTMYVPLDYKFKHIRSNENPLKIYYSNELYVTFKDFSGMTDAVVSDFFRNNKNIVYDYSEDDKLNVYHFSFNYNSKYEDFINTLSISTVYSLPYINGKYTWMVNGSDTDISALGKNAGNPNIILLYCDKTSALSDSKKILFAAKQDFLNSLDWEERSFTVNSNIVADEGRASCYAVMPVVLKADDAETLANSLIFCFSKYNKDGEYKSDSADYLMISSLWALVSTEENGVTSYRFEMIENPSNPEESLDFNDLFNISQIAESITLENKENLNFPIDQLILKAYIDTAQQTSRDPDNYIFIKNEKASYYNSYNIISPSLDSNYDNDLNMTVRYWSKISGIGSDSAYGWNSSDERYLSYAFNDAENGKAFAYMYPMLAEETEDVTSLVSTASFVNDTVNQTTNVEVTDGEYTFAKSETVPTETGSTSKIYTTVSQTVSTVSKYKYKDGSYYSEYVPNYDIPTLELKEILMRDANVINRANIISVSYNGTMSHAYIGTSWEDENKNALHIGTSNVNINIGTDSLAYVCYLGTFNTFSELDLDFPLTKAEKVKMKSSYYADTINGVSYYSAQIMPAVLFNDSKYFRYAFDDSEGTYIASSSESTALEGVLCAEGQQVLSTGAISTEFFLNLKELFSEMFGISLQNAEYVKYNDYSGSDNYIVYSDTSKNNAFIKIDGDYESGVPSFIEMPLYIKAYTFNGTLSVDISSQEYNISQYLYKYLEDHLTIEKSKNRLVQLILKK